MKIQKLDVSRAHESHHLRHRAVSQAVAQPINYCNLSFTQEFEEEVEKLQLILPGRMVSTSHGLGHLISYGQLATKNLQNPKA